MSPLERRYRLLLRALPAWYRARRADEMVDAFLTGWHEDHYGDDVDELDDLDAADLEYGWPGWAEAWSIALLAVRTRLAARSAPPRTLAAGQTVRLVALLGLLTQAALGIAELVTPPRFPFDRFGPGVPVLLAAAGELATIAAFVALARGDRGLARASAAGALVPGVVALVRATVVPAGGPWDAVVLVHLPLWVAIAALFAGFHREAPPPAMRPWLWALAVGAGVGLAWALVVAWLPTDPPTAALIGDPGALSAWAVVAAGLAYPALIRRRGPDRSGVVAAALAIVSATTLPARLRAADAADQLGTGFRMALSTELIAMAVAIAVLVAFGVAGLRRPAGAAAPWLTRPSDTDPSPGDVRNR